MPKVQTNGQVLHYAETGQGQPLLFLNGLAGDHLYWMGQLRAFASGKFGLSFRCLALDNRDAGQSSYATGPYTIANLADDVAGFLEALAVPAAHVVGLSLGGMIAQELALRHPGRVSSLVLLGTLGRADAWFNATLDAYTHIRRQVPNSCEFFVALLPWLIGPPFFTSVERVDWLAALLRNHPYPQQLDGFMRQFDAIRGHDTLDRLSAVRCPVQVLVGEHDAICPPRYSEELAARLPQARLRMLPGVGHAPPIEDARGFNQALADFLTTPGVARAS
jgi:pimeloyl-ACP methyl ester carboxylesterase